MPATHPHGSGRFERSRRMRIAGSASRSRPRAKADRRDDPRDAKIWPGRRSSALLTHGRGLPQLRPADTLARHYPIRTMVLAHAVSDAGPVRKNNEDSCAVEHDLQVYVVADGMGGHNAGEVASRLAVEALVGFMRRSHEDTDVSWPYGIDPTISLHANRLRTAINLANRRVFRAAESHDDYTGMGTTVVAALVTGTKLVVGNVGDSRLYVSTNDGFSQVTEDDT